MNLTEQQKKQFNKRFQDVLEYRLGLRLMAELADKLGETREAFADRADTMDQAETDKLIKSNFTDSEIEIFAEEESKKIISEISGDANIG